MPTLRPRPLDPPAPDARLLLVDGQDGCCCSAPATRAAAGPLVVRPRRRPRPGRTTVRAGLHRGCGGGPAPRCPPPSSGPVLWTRLPLPHDLAASTSDGTPGSSGSPAGGRGRGRSTATRPVRPPTGWTARASSTPPARPSGPTDSAAAARRPRRDGAGAPPATSGRRRHADTGLRPRGSGPVRPASALGRLQTGRMVSTGASRRRVDLRRLIHGGCHRSRGPARGPRGRPAGRRACAAPSRPTGRSRRPGRQHRRGLARRWVSARWAAVMLGVPRSSRSQRASTGCAER